MYPNPLLNNSLSLTKILGGISKTISVANQVIPIYKQAKPLISNFANTASIIKSITKDSSTTKNNVKEAKIENIETIEKHIINAPTFFQ